MAGDDVRMQWGIRLPLSDGTQLSGTLYLPSPHPDPSPAILTLSPYIGQHYHDRGVNFAANGYPFLVVDARGRGNSEGQFRPLIQEVQDGYDVVEWLSQQPCCDGRVAMSGGSYTGYDQWVTAARAPPHLASIVPLASPHIATDFPLRKNIFTPYIMQWLTLVSGHTSQDRLFASQSFWRSKFRQWFEAGLPFRELDRFLGNPSAIFQEWISHPHQDAYWDAYNPTAEQYGGLDVPVLTITGIYDGDQLGALHHYREHIKNAPAGAARHYLVIGPWDHFGTRTPQTEFVGLKVGPASLIDVGRLELEWNAWTMLGGAKPQFLQKRVAYYVMGAERWRYADTLEDVTEKMQPLFLDSRDNPTDVLRSGLLRTDRAGGGGADHFRYDPQDVSLAGLECAVDPENRADQRMVYASVGRQLVYHSEPFEQDIEVTGFFTLTVWIAIDTPDTDFRAMVYDVNIDGSAVQMSSDWVRARYREGLREERLINTRAPLKYEFDGFTFVSRRIARGNRLRLVIGPINSIYSQKNYNTGGPVAEESMQGARPVLVKLFHDETYPSALHVPLGRSEE